MKAFGCYVSPSSALRKQRVDLYYSEKVTLSIFSAPWVVGDTEGRAGGERCRVFQLFLGLDHDFS